MTEPQQQTDSSGRRVYVWPGHPDPLISVTTVVSAMHDYGLDYVRRNVIAKAAVEDNSWHELSDEDAVRFLSGAADRNANEAAAEGQAIHVNIARQFTRKEAAVDVEDKWWESGSSDHVDAAIDFLYYHNLDGCVHAVELPVANFQLGYAGTADFVATGPDGKLWLIDWKTGAHIKRQAALQLVGLSKCTHYWHEGKTHRFSQPIHHKLIAKLGHRQWRKYRLLGHDPKAWSIFQNLIPVGKYDLEEANTVGNLFEPSSGRKVAKQ